jgi:hypothetical protein
MEGKCVHLPGSAPLPQLSDQRPPVATACSDNKQSTEHQTSRVSGRLRGLHPLVSACMSALLPSNASPPRMAAECMAPAPHQPTDGRPGLPPRCDMEHPCLPYARILTALPPPRMPRQQPLQDTPTPRVTQPSPYPPDMHNTQHNCVCLLVVESDLLCGAFMCGGGPLPVGHVQVGPRPPRQQTTHRHTRLLPTPQITH